MGTDGCRNNITTDDHSCRPLIMPCTVYVIAGTSPPHPAPHLCVWEVVACGADADVDLARQVGKLLIAQAAVEQQAVHLMQNWPGCRRQGLCTGQAL